MKNRKHARIRLEYVLSLSGDRIRGQGVVPDLSEAGYRARSAVAVSEGDSMGVLIDIPHFANHLHVPRGVVLWSRGQEFGMEFIEMEPGDQQRLRDLIRQTEAARARRQDKKT